MQSGEKINVKQLIEDYKRGASIAELAKRYGRSPATIWEKLIREVETRSVSQAWTAKHGEWRKLTRMRGTATRLISLPAELLRKIGLDPTKPLERKLEIRGNKLCLRFREAPTDRQNRRGQHTEWALLTRVGHTCTRTVSVPWRVLKQLGFDKRDELQGRWLVENGTLLIEVAKLSSGEALKSAP